MNQVQQFDPDQRMYDAWSPGGPAIVRAYSTDPAAFVTYTYWDANGLIERGTMGLGGGEFTLDVPTGDSGMAVYVKAPEGASDFYRIDISDSFRPNTSFVAQIFGGGESSSAQHQMTVSVGGPITGIASSANYRVELSLPGTPGGK